MNAWEEKRVDKVNEFKDIDFLRTGEFQSIVDLATEICEKPIGFLSLIDQQYNWFKIVRNFPIKPILKESSFCQYTIQSDELLIIPDASKDDRFSSNELVTGNMHIRFYAASPLVSSDGKPVGALCVFDSKPGQLSTHQQQILKILARQVMYLMEMESNQKRIQMQLEQAERQNRALQQIAFIQSHEIRHPLTIIMSLVNLAKKGVFSLNQKWVDMLSQAAETLDERIRAIVNETATQKDIKLARFNRMVQEIEDYAILLLDENGRIENWNLGAELVKGYREEEILGKNFSVFYSSRDIANGKPQRLIAEAKEFGKARDEGWRVRKNGSQFWASVLITAIHDKDGKVIGFTKVTKDLGESGIPQ
ncbi:GAF domain-containing protein [Pedobacter aquatilis]|uniref:GAF domain-containing protein n=1 Tax=Pedobacter aquatilis TaxID=351343 RepID=UPI00292D0B15|nr:GAF domain-containing protein [Pedobacter aquatilis]